MTLHRNPSARLWRFEVGVRAARYTETLPRDLRWFRGLMGRSHR